MYIKTQKNEDTLIVNFYCELDHHAAKSIKDEIIAILSSDESIKNINLDMESLNIMDSSGIGVILSLYKIVNLRDGKITVLNSNKTVKKIFEIAGLKKIIEVV